MLFKEIKTESDWTIVEYRTTWPYDYEFVLDAAQELIDTDFHDSVERLAVSDESGKERELLQSVKMCGFDLRKCPASARENAALSIAGKSRAMESAFQLVFCTGTDSVRLCSPNGDYFKENGEHVFDNYMNSIEIKAYCRQAVRQAMA